MCHRSLPSFGLGVRLFRAVWTAKGKRYPSLYAPTLRQGSGFVSRFTRVWGITCPNLAMRCHPCGDRPAPKAHIRFVCSLRNWSALAAAALDAVDSTNSVVPVIVLVMVLIQTMSVPASLRLRLPPPGSPMSLIGNLVSGKRGLHLKIGKSPLLAADTSFLPQSHPIRSPSLLK